MHSQCMWKLNLRGPRGGLSGPGWRSCAPHGILNSIPLTAPFNISPNPSLTSQSCCLAQRRNKAMKKLCRLHLTKPPKPRTPNLNPRGDCEAVPALCECASRNLNPQGRESIFRKPFKTPEPGTLKKGRASFLARQALIQVEPNPEPQT